MYKTEESRRLRVQENLDVAFSLFKEIMEHPEKADQIPDDAIVIPIFVKDRK